MAILTTFNANLNTNLIQLVFDVAVTAIDPTQIYALSSATDTNRNLTFAGATITGLGTTTVTLSIPTNLANLINSTPGLWQSTLNTYILVNALATSPTLGGDTIQMVTTFQRNTTVPVISAFTFQPGTNAPWNLKIDLNLASNVSNPPSIYVNSNAITLQSTASGGNTFAVPAIPTTTLLSAGYSTSVLLKLNSTALASLTSSNICTGSGTTYLSATNTFINNRFGENNTPRLSSAALLGTYVAGSNTQYPGYYSNSVGDLRLAGGSNGINNQAVITDGQANLSYQSVFTTGVTTVTATSYAATFNDSVIVCTNTSPVSVALPAPTANSVGRTFIVKDNSGIARNITVTGANIDGQGSIVFSNAYGSATFIGTSPSTWGRIA